MNNNKITKIKNKIIYTIWEVVNVNKNLEILNADLYYNLDYNKGPT